MNEWQEVKSGRFFNSSAKEQTLKTILKKALHFCGTVRG